MRFYCNFFTSQQIKLKLHTWIQNWMLILINGSKNCFSYDFGQYDTKTTIICLFGQMPFRNNVAMATPNVPCDQILFLNGLLHANNKHDRFAYLCSSFPRAKFSHMQEVYCTIEFWGDTHKRSVCLKFINGLLNH